MLATILDRTGSRTYPELCHVEHDVLVEGICHGVNVRTCRDGKVYTWTYTEVASIDACNSKSHAREAASSGTGIARSQRPQREQLEGPNLMSGNDWTCKRYRSYLYARDTNPDVCSLDHADVIRAITDCQQDRLLVLLYQLDDEGLLKRRDTTCEESMSGALPV